MRIAKRFHHLVGPMEQRGGTSPPRGTRASARRSRRSPNRCRNRPWSTCRRSNRCHRHRTHSPSAVAKNFHSGRCRTVVSMSTASRWPGLLDPKEQLLARLRTADPLEPRLGAARNRLARKRQKRHDVPGSQPGLPAGTPRGDLPTRSPPAAELERSPQLGLPGPVVQAPARDRLVPCRPKPGTSDRPRRRPTSRRRHGPRRSGRVAARSDPTRRG